MSRRARQLGEALRSRILVIDGAMGTMIQKAALGEEDYRADLFNDQKSPLGGNNELLSITQPALIAGIHRSYLEAGADIIETNTFNANAISQQDYGCQGLVSTMNRRAAELACAVALEVTSRDPLKPRFVAGSIGPTNRSLSISSRVEDPAQRDFTFREMASLYAEQVRALIEGGVDLLLVETGFDTLNLKAALHGIESVFEQRGLRLPLMLSGTIVDASGRTLSGQTVEAFWISVSHADALSIGLNCGLGPREMLPHIQTLSRLAPTYTSCYPNAGFPNELGDYELGPEVMAEIVREMAEEGWVNLVGGCCGTTPEHIRAMAETVAGLPARRPPERDWLTRLAGLEPLVIHPESNLVVIGERANVMGSRRFSRLVESGDWEGALSVARGQVEGGANLLDVCMDADLLDAEASMTTFLRHLASDPEVARLPLMIDSSSLSVIEAGLQNAQGKCLVNSISLKEGEAAFLRTARLLERYGAAVVVMAFDEEGQAVTTERRVEICSRAYRLLTVELGFCPSDIVFDPNVLTVATGLEEHQRYALSFFEATRQLKEAFPLARVLGGISNVSFALRANQPVREAMHALFLFHAVKAGLDMAIVNAGQLPIVEDIEPELRQAIEDVLLDRRPDATERLVEMARGVRTKEIQASVEEVWRGRPLEERLAWALVHGRVEHLDEDLGEAQHTFGSALEIIEGPLLEGMKRVGDLFGEGKMFLPQVVKSARVMKRAVSILEPALEDEKQALGALGFRGKVLLATVPGDVHDIGKNIVGLVLSCHNYQVLDLGVMVPRQRIIEEAIAQQVDVIGLSGLISPSLEEMVLIAGELDRQGFEVPLLIGGATTSPRHTAVRIATKRDAPVVHVSDASRASQVVGALLNPNLAAEFIEENRTRQERLREQFEQKQRGSLLPYKRAVENRLRLDWESLELARPKKTGLLVVRDFPLELLSEHIDWRQFLATWELRGSYPEILEHPSRGSVARELLAEARTLLEQIVSERLLTAQGVFGLFAANSQGDDLVVWHDLKAERERLRFPMLRQQRQPTTSQNNLSLADFLAPVEAGRVDYLGLFAVNTGERVAHLATRFSREGDDYRAIMVRVLADCLAESFAEQLHQEALREWGLAGENRGIRPAIGYPICPDHSQKEGVFELLDVEEQVGLRLTESYMMDPPAAVCGFVFLHPQSRYFGLGSLGRDQVEDYARRTGRELVEVERLLLEHLGYKSEDHGRIEGLTVGR